MRVVGSLRRQCNHRLDRGSLSCNDCSGANADAAWLLNKIDRQHIIIQKQMLFTNKNRARTSYPGLRVLCASGRTVQQPSPGIPPESDPSAGAIWQESADVARGGGDVFSLESQRLPLVTCRAMGLG